MTGAGSAIRALLPQRAKEFARDLLESVKRRIPRTPRGIPALGLADTQLYPHGNNLLPILRKALSQKLAHLGLTASTPVASIGTCFAEEFAIFMQRERCNYIQTEKDAFAASANWGRVYTVPNLLQIVRYSIECDFPLIVERTDAGWIDPLREYTVTPSPTREDAEMRVRQHREASLEALRSCEVLVITVGQNEAWTDMKNDMVWGRIPPREILAARRADFVVKEFGYRENVRDLNGIIERLLKLNPKLRILFTVSPVASHATFSDCDVVSRSFANKCLLRAAVHEVLLLHDSRVFYFPSFEMVLCDNPYSFVADNRHVTRATVRRIFKSLASVTGLSRR